MGTKKKLKKGFVSYFKSNGIKKHVDVDHGLIVKKLRKK
jgi:hypothetical protein